MIRICLCGKLHMESYSPKKKLHIFNVLKKHEKKNFSFLFKLVFSWTSHMFGITKQQ